MALKKATKEQAKLRLFIYGLSGGGKTYSALAIAEGLVKAFGGKIAVLDTEFRSASKYANIFNFETDDFGEPSIENYIKFIDMVKEDPDVTVLIIDSLTHAWQNILETVDKLKETSCRGDSRKAWGQMTPVYKRLVNAILMAPFHVIGTARAKTEWSTSNENGSKTVRRDTLAPEQRDGFEYEFDMVMELNANHYGTIIKDRTNKFQDEIVQKPGIEFGKRLADWLKDGAVPMENQIKNVLDEIGNIIKSRSEKDEPYFTDDEYKSIKKMCIDSMSQSQEVRLEFLQKILKDQKEILHNRVGQPQSSKPAPASIPKQEPKGDGTLSDELKKIAAKKQSGNTQETTVATEVPEMFNEPEKPRYFEDDIPGEENIDFSTDGQQLDIF